MEQESVNVETLLNKDCVYDWKTVQHYTNANDAHPERPTRKCTNCGDTGHTQNGFKRWKGQQYQIVGCCSLRIRGFKAPQLNTDWMICRAGLRDSYTAWNRRLRRRTSIWRHTKHQAIEAAESLVHKIMDVVRQAIKSERAKNLPSFGEELRAAVTLMSEYMQTEKN